MPAGMRTTTRLRAALAVAVEDGRDQSEVAAAHRVSWPTVQRAVVAHGAVELVEPEPTTVLDMDETRFGRPRWLPDGHHDDGRIRWVRTDPRETGFVNIRGDQGLFGRHRRYTFTRAEPLGSQPMVPRRRPRAARGVAIRARYSA